MIFDSGILAESIMNFLKFLFDFLYERNWHTGKKELSYRRLYWLVASFIVTVCAIVLIIVLQSPTVFN